MSDTLYTIGYAGFSPGDFVNTLQANRISLVADVRSRPFSRHFPDYNQDCLAGTLTLAGIRYRSYAREFGARQEDRRLHARGGYPDFELVARAPLFLSGFEKLAEDMKQGCRAALMCAEKDPFNCHRAILVSRAFRDAGYSVIHLLPDNKITTQEELEARLLEKYFPNRDQLTLFDEPLDDADRLQQAYRKRNAEIGYAGEEERK